MGHEYVVGVMVVHVVEAVIQEHMVVHVPWPPLRGSASYLPLPLDLVKCLCPVSTYNTPVQYYIQYIRSSMGRYILNLEGALRYAEYVRHLVEGEGGGGVATIA